MSDSQRDRIAAADAELDEVAGRLASSVRQRHPELFDRRGRLRRRALGQLLADRAGKESLSDSDLASLHGPSGAAVRRVAVDAILAADPMPVPLDPADLRDEVDAGRGRVQR